MVSHEQEPGGHCVLSDMLDTETPKREVFMQQERSAVVYQRSFEYLNVFSFLIIGVGELVTLLGLIAYACEIVHCLET